MNTTDLLLEGEIWKDIIGYEGLYQVSNLGRVKSFPKEKIVCGHDRTFFTEEKIMSFSTTKYGYQHAHLTINKKGKKIPAHRLVAIHFIPNPENKPQVNHINGIKTDNRVENLEWCTAKENINHGWINGLYKVRSGEKCYQSVFKESDVMNIIKRLKSGERTCDLCREYNVSKGAIKAIKDGSTWKHIDRNNL